MRQSLGISSTANTAPRIANPLMGTADTDTRTANTRALY